MYQVPAQTLRDRVLDKIHIDTTTTGRAPVLSLEEEAKLVGHLKEVANLGYGYTQQEVVDIASDYAYALGVRPKDKPLTLMKRELHRIISPLPLSLEQIITPMPLLLVDLKLQQS